MIYLASPYSDPDPDVREARFRSVCLLAAELIAQGHVVFCPIAHSHPIEVHGGLMGGWELWRDQDIPLLDMAEYLPVACYPGWEQSEGVQAEIRHWERTWGELFPPVYHHFTDLPIQPEECHVA
jgi:hypothetical protein